MKKSILFGVMIIALGASSDLALAKHRAHAHVCPTVTHYFSWFTTYSDVCIEDIVDAQTLRQMRGEGNHTPASAVPAPPPPP